MTENEKELEVLDEGKGEAEELAGCCASGSTKR
jgi:putative radical SAM-modified peptide